MAQAVTDGTNFTPTHSNQTKPRLILSVVHTSTPDGMFSDDEVSKNACLAAQRARQNLALVAK
jgi:hypothetical protein